MCEEPLYCKLMSVVKEKCLIITGDTPMSALGIGTNTKVEHCPCTEKICSDITTQILVVCVCI